MEGSCKTQSGITKSPHPLNHKLPIHQLQNAVPRKIVVFRAEEAEIIEVEA